MLIEDLERLERGDIDKLLVNAPPGSAKSTYGSVLFEPWAMARQPYLMVIGASHTSDMAELISGRILKIIMEFGSEIGLACATEGVKGWSTRSGCEYKPVGVGGTVTGRRGDIGVIDDPVKSAADAKSLTSRDAVWEWYWNDFVTRLKPSGRQLLIMTRWHEDDLAGRLLATAPEEWKQLCIRAESDGPEDDPLGRPKGVMLWSDDVNFAFGKMMETRKRELIKAGALATWESLYQQRPSPADGDIFKPFMITIVHAVPVGTKFVRGWDFAATAQVGSTDPDWTVGFKLGLCPDGSYLIAAVKRFRGGPEVVEKELLQTATTDTKRVSQNLPQDPGAAGKVVIFSYTKLLSGFDVKSSLESGDKVERASPFAAQVNVGNVKMLSGDYNEAVLDEMRSFPTGKHDDIIDGGSRAFAALQQEPEPAKLTRIPFMRR